LVKDGVLPQSVVKEAIEKYGLDPDRPDPYLI